MESHDSHVLVTGANSGLGLGVCTRLIDDFASTRRPSQSLTLVFTTRSPQKAADTLKTLQAHIDAAASSAAGRIHLRPENVELTNLLSVRGLAQKLLTSDLPRLDAIILNAGIGGWTGLDWPLAIRTVLMDMRRATTWPTFKIGVAGLVTRPQLSSEPSEKLREPPLGEVFCANVFGHYMLAHWLMPLFSACPATSPAKIIWVSSVEARRRHFNPADIQGLQTSAPYEHTKRLTDYLALTQGQPAAEKYVASYTAVESQIATHERCKKSHPTVHTTHPGILTTTIIDLYWIVHQAYLLAIYMARWLNSPWATVNPYPAAISAVWLALVSRDELDAKETRDGGKAVKWGSAVDRSGRARVETTDVEGWGINGSGKPFGDTWWAGPSWWLGGHVGRPAGAEDASKEDVENFIVQGADVWKQMESLRVEWEQRLDSYEKL